MVLFVKANDSLRLLWWLQLLDEFTDLLYDMKYVEPQDEIERIISEADRYRKDYLQMLSEIKKVVKDAVSEPEIIREASAEEQSAHDRSNERRQHDRSVRGLTARELPCIQTKEFLVTRLYILSKYIFQIDPN